MTRFRIVTLTSSVALAAGLSLVLATTAGAAPGDFFPGGDLGIVPPDSPKGPITKCETGIAKATGKLWGALEKCHIGLAIGKLDGTGEVSCEQAAMAKFETVNTIGCAPCTATFDALNRIAANLEVQVDNPAFGSSEPINGLIYCAWPTTPCARDLEACSCGDHAGQCLADINPNEGSVCTACNSCNCSTCSSDADCGANAFCIADTKVGFGCGGQPVCCQ